MTIFYVLVFFCAFGLLGEKPEAKKYYVLALTATIAGIIAVRILEML